RLHQILVQRLERRPRRGRAHPQQHQRGEDLLLHRPVSHHFERIVRATLVPQCTSPSPSWNVSQSSAKCTSTPSAPRRWTRSALNGSTPSTIGPNGSGATTLLSTNRRFTVPG